MSSQQDPVANNVADCKGSKTEQGSNCYATICRVGNACHSVVVSLSQGLFHIWRIWQTENHPKVDNSAEHTSFFVDTLCSSHYWRTGWVSSWNLFEIKFANFYLETYQHQDTCCDAAFQQCPILLVQGVEPLQSHQGGSPPHYGRSLHLSYSWEAQKNMMNCRVRNLVTQVERNQHWALCVWNESW